MGSNHLTDNRSMSLIYEWSKEDQKAVCFWTRAMYFSQEKGEENWVKKVSIYCLEISNVSLSLL
jgi:hypothetical protein